MRSQAMPAHVVARAPRAGGPWIYRADAAKLLADKRDKGAIDDALAAQLESLIARGYVHLPSAVPPPVIDGYRALFDRIWDAPPRGLQYLDDSGVAPVSAAVRDQIVRVINLHLHYAAGPALMFPAAVVRLLAAVYERPPVCFQSMSFRHGSQQPIHVDTAYLPLVRDPFDLTASWTALEDVQEGSGELVYYEGSHRLAEEFLFGGRSKAVADGPEQHAEFLEWLTAECERRALPRRSFLPRKGDVLVWAADFAHGGAAVTRPGVLRRSFVCHFMPFGTRPAFYDASRERIVAYGSGFRLERESERGGPIARLVRRLSSLGRGRAPRAT